MALAIKELRPTARKDSTLHTYTMWYVSFEALSTGIREIRCNQFR